VSEENLKVLSRLGALISEGYPFAGLQAKIKAQRVDLIAPQGAMAAVVDAVSRFRASAKLSPVQLLVVSTGREAEDVAATLRSLDPAAEILEFPSWETLPHERLSPSPETVGRRLKVLHRLNDLSKSKESADHSVYVLASVRAVLQPVVAGLANHPPLTLEQSKDYLLFELSLKLIEMAYHRVDMVTKRGEFAVRGGILDIFPTTAEHALRLEFFGDELEDIREFSVADQRSIHNPDGTIANIKSVEIYPAREIIITPNVAGRAREMLHEFPNISTMLAKIAEGIPVDGMESLAPVLVDSMIPFTDYLPKDALAMLLSPEKSAARAHSLVETNDEFLHAAWDAATEGAQAPIDLSSGGFVEMSQFKDALDGRQLFTISQFGADDDTLINLGLFEVPNFKGLETTSIEWLEDQAKNGQQIILVAEGHGTVERLNEQLNAAGINAQIAQGSMRKGFTAPDAKLIVLTEGEFYGKSTAYVSPQVH
jgi:transcription-repair coupling factor (superfamily II helicase)